MNRDNGGCSRILPQDAHVSSPTLIKLEMHMGFALVQHPTDVRLPWSSKLVPLSDTHCAKEAAGELRVAVCDIARCVHAL